MIYCQNYGIHGDREFMIFLQCYWWRSSLNMQKRLCKELLRMCFIFMVCRHRILYMWKYWNATTLLLHHCQANCSIRQRSGVHIRRTISHAATPLTGLQWLRSWAFAVTCHWWSTMNLKSGLWKTTTSYRLVLWSPMIAALLLHLYGPHKVKKEGII